MLCEWADTGSSDLIACGGFYSWLRGLSIGVFESRSDTAQQSAKQPDACASPRAHRDDAHRVTASRRRSPPSSPPPS